MQGRNKIVDLGNYAPPFRPPDNDCFSLKIGGMVYEVTTHFNTEGKETMLQ